MQIGGNIKQKKDKLGKKTTNLTKSQRNAVKKKFTGFNREFYDQYMSQRAYSIPDPNLKSEMQQKNINIISQKYGEFWRRYKPVEFSHNNKSKHMKYDVSQVEKMLHAFFDGEAI